MALHQGLQEKYLDTRFGGNATDNYFKDGIEYSEEELIFNLSEEEFAERGETEHKKQLLRILLNLKKGTWVFMTEFGFQKFMTQYKRRRLSRPKSRVGFESIIEGTRVFATEHGFQKLIQYKERIEPDLNQGWFRKHYRKEQECSQLNWAGAVPKIVFLGHWCPLSKLLFWLCHLTY